MDCKADVAGRIIHAEHVIKSSGNTDGLYAAIYDAIYRCPDLGDLDAKNNLMLIVDYHLDQFYRHAEPEARSLDELRSRPVPPPTAIRWRH